MLIGIDASRAAIKEKTGTENYASNLIQKLIEIDPKNRYVLYSRETPRAVVPTSPSSEVARRDSSDGGTAEYKNIPWPYLWTQGGLALECFLHPPDILFIPAHTMPIIRRPSLKVVVTIHGLEYQYLPDYYRWPQCLYLNKTTEYAVRHATHLIAVSQWTKKQLVEKLGADPKKITVVYEGVPKTPRTVARQRPRLLRGEIEDTPYILFVGTIQPRKNLVRLIEAFASLQNLTRCDLVIAGKKGWMYDEIYAAPKRFGVEKRVKFLGYVSDKKLAGLYNSAACFVLSSLCEGFGLPVLEAMAHGCPVIAGKAGALPEVVGRAGLLVDPYSVEELAKAMRLMMENQELGEGLREKGFKRVRQFSWQKAARETIRVFERVYFGG